MRVHECGKEDSGSDLPDAGLYDDEFLAGKAPHVKGGFQFPFLAQIFHMRKQKFDFLPHRANDCDLHASSKIFAAWAMSFLICMSKASGPEYLISGRRYFTKSTAISSP